MATNIILEKAKQRAASRKRIGEEYKALTRLSFNMLIDECGGQSNAAEIISCFYGIKKWQGTVSKARKRNCGRTRHELRIAVDFLSFRQHAAEVMHIVMAHFGNFPVYHDILKHRDRCVIYVDSIMISGVCSVVVVNQEGKTETLPLAEMEVV
ncbi:hypothetical protein P3551_23010 [Vibrio parahaemolyticus]|uniref:hypothetical protein n=1 Tax=Vibrio parahaemolyticus TaxID=670 RepID=UPI0011242A39|nr:hypothetical protein [Vibrio parahaemolyticus]MBE3985597.1 hypothetical protein [Vibrio parahaemolyticus]MBE4286496.1 hypothetical protein [Vibrio parahaemolyticus]MDF4902156.1 hypothetical protein [Vibrio parahaemolyticus]HCG7330539.1 hypothetical protein [Vibrio parahaemolyticus]HCG8859877.1 hypothetical protein [Vibrio parahaemolyticus]